jgi:hypothetical protein
MFTFVLFFWGGGGGRRVLNHQIMEVSWRDEPERVRKTYISQESSDKVTVSGLFLNTK